MNHQNKVLSKKENVYSPYQIKNHDHSNENRMSPMNKKIIWSAIIGNGLEFYDFALFGAFSLTFSQLFFTGDKISSLLSTLSIFAVAFFMRPIGSLFFGYLGDVFGRKKALSYSIIFMGMFTFLIGCLPLYQDVGYFAPLLLLCCRLGQGFCLGGENNGSAIFLLEHLQKRKGYAGALILTGGAAGTLLATFFAAVTNLSFMPEWAWRLPFLFGILIGLLGTYIRRSLEETPEFLLLKEKKQRASPLFFVLKNYTRQFLCAVGIGGVNGVLAYTLVVYINVYLTTIVKYPLTSSLFCSCIGLVIFGSLSPFVGYLADKIGERRVMLFGCSITLIFSPLIFYLLQQQNIFLILLAIVMSAVLMSTFNSPTNALLQSLFPTRARYTGIAFGYAVGVALLGGTQPLICSYLIDVTQNPFSPAFYIMFAVCIGVLSLFFCRKRETNSLGFSQMMPEYSLPSKLKSEGIPSLEKDVVFKG